MRSAAPRHGRLHACAARYTRRLWTWAVRELTWIGPENMSIRDSPEPHDREQSTVPHRRDHLAEAATLRCYRPRVPRRLNGSTSVPIVSSRSAHSVRGRQTRTLLRAVVLVALLLVVFIALRYNDQPGLAISLYALIPILLSVFWFALPGGMLTATAALTTFLVDILITPSGLEGISLALATFNRAAVFFGAAILLTLLLRRERALAIQVREQEVALAELQSLRAALTPSRIPTTPHLDIATFFRPAEGPVAGDFFLVVEGPSDSTTIVVGDVVGHGVEAARCAAFVRATLAMSARFTSDPAQLLQLANTALLERSTESSQFVTAACLNIGGTREPTVRWAAAGHESPWYLDSATPLAGGRVSAPLGVAEEALKIEVGHALLGSGAGFLVFTDGLVEGRPARRKPAARNPAARVELFGEERARSIVRQHRGAPATRVVEALDAAVSTFAGGPLADDLCLVAVRVRAPRVPTPPVDAPAAGEPLVVLPAEPPPTQKA